MSQSIGVLPDREVEFEETAEPVMGAIRDDHFGHGAMKNAYHFKTSDGNALVSDGDSIMAPPLSVADNREQIYLELKRLTIAAYFLKAFHRHAKHCGVDVYAALSFADAWLGQETNQPSVASGTSKIDASHEGYSHSWLPTPPPSTRRLPAFNDQFTAANIFSTNENTRETPATTEPPKKRRKLASDEQFGNRTDAEICENRLIWSLYKAISHGGRGGGGEGSAEA
ncbi:hypothetical protein B0H14DRAFT_2600986 [Mycena olivaceomarginata]|nr:hypothetical protein B0H14DRAFT_2600986 [Mycena olivaceomarginata]